MRTFKKSIVALVAVAAVAVPAGTAMAGTGSATTAGSALGDCTGVVNLCSFSILDDSNNTILSNINVTSAIAACPNVNVIGLLVGQVAACKNSQHSEYKNIVRNN